MDILSSASPMWKVDIIIVVIITVLENWLKLHYLWDYIKNDQS